MSDDPRLHDPRPDAAGGQPGGIPPSRAIQTERDVGTPDRPTRQQIAGQGGRGVMGSSVPTQPIQTPDIPPLWGNPVSAPPGDQWWPPEPPPVLNTKPPVNVWTGEPIPELPPQRYPGSPPLPTRMPNDRHPTTGAPIWNPKLPADRPLPPSWNVTSDPTGQHPVTGAPVRGEGGGPIVRQGASAGGTTRTGNPGSHSYPWTTPAAETHPAQAGGTIVPEGEGPQGAINQGGPTRPRS